MRTQWLYLSFLIIVLFGCSTAKPKTTIPPDDKPVIIEDIYRDWLSRGTFRRVNCDTLYYTRTTEHYLIDSAIARIAGDRNFKIHSLHRTSPGASPLVLTPDEQNYLIKELKKLKTHVWADNLFPKSKAISFSEIETSLRVTGNMKTENHRNMCSIIYTFSKPIFIRNNTICLYLDQERYRGNYTQLEYGFYLKEGVRWERYAQVYIHYESSER